MRNLLITGGAGNIGRKLRRELGTRFARIRILDAVAPAALAANEEAVQADISDIAAVERAMAGMDAVIHMAGVVREAPFEAILQTNVVGTWNVYEAARRQGVGRVVFGSSNHAVGFYPRHQRIDETVPPRPDGRYGLSKCWGEAVGALYADKYGIRSMHVRIGNAADIPGNARTLRIWISGRDLAQLCLIGLEHPDIHNTIVYGVSDNVGGWYDNAVARGLGYRPQDHAEDYTEEAMAGEAELTHEPPALYFQGGGFCALEYAGAPVPPPAPSA
ncbi:NAD(P)-dependent oxidoreductase [Bosea sp. F3-2]|uniref:NAD-dependent epimerase/dehydratase family protein n=1 Tax=Bosea sp. F3-2 TaxID=2599640 RepID=UPI0011EE321A|nr:NAD(P)-dependent oxidoreductase [Bosea sp. F3-2]QEL26515.1 NAD(P)-dependent oxidoreductase [Bosea sp. F3-2]